MTEPALSEILQSASVVAVLAYIVWRGLALIEFIVKWSLGVIGKIADGKTSTDSEITD